MPALPVTRCQQQQLLQVPKAGGGGGEGKDFDPPRGAISSQGVICSSVLEEHQDLDMPGVGTAAASQGLELCPGLGKVSASLGAGDFSCEAHKASGWESRSLQDPFSKWFRLTDSLIDCLID